MTRSVDQVDLGPYRTLNTSVADAALAGAAFLSVADDADLHTELRRLTPAGDAAQGLLIVADLALGCVARAWCMDKMRTLDIVIDNVASHRQHTSNDLACLDVIGVISQDPTRVALAEASIDGDQRLLSSLEDMARTVTSYLVMAGLDIEVFLASVRAAATAHIVTDAA